ncbi:MAG: 1-(5-phosphoribosyl)-5-((5-phosphoribosylamino)methylideneamino)imidazole-4-carboxamide isomerase, partial [Firmicutes bacterium]|nr:1-(5-phosphoribosyl)-5-((5-phosphoribosylamino)methylideneamino)imidazole-4-carboxamide isomerase [Bacillota bacterium]
VGRVILGTIAIKDPAFLEEMVSKYGDKIAVGVDARDGFVAINGWKEITDKKGIEFCKYLKSIGVKTVIYTDISRDGGLEGTNMEVYRELQEIEGLEITASGGISFEEEITALKDVVDSAILGKAIYSGKLNLARAVELAK